MIPNLLAKAKGTDAQFLEWTRRQESCVSGLYTEWVNGEGRNPACHIRRSKNSGIAFKPQYAAVAMTQAEHLIQHQHGEAHLLTQYFGRPFTREDAADWFDEQAALNLKRWIES